MTKQADAIIIGAGVIGASIAYELAKRGYKTLNIDKLPERGLRPDEQLVLDRARALLVARRRGDGLRGLLLLEGLGELPRRRRRPGHGQVHELRHGAAQERHRPRREGAHALPRPRRRARGVGRRRRSRSASRSTTPTRSGRPSARTTRSSGPSPSASCTGAIYTPGSGYMNDPQLDEPQPPARRRGARRRVPVPQARSARSAARTAA